MSDWKKIVKASVLGFLSVVCILGMHSQLVNSKESDRQNSPSTSSSCPTDLELLSDRMLEELPNYANRVIQRSKSVAKTKTSSLNVILAGRPEFEPLKLENSEYTPLFPETSKQVFFTTLERTYVSKRAIETNNYHWLFLAPTDNGWQVVMMFSQFGSARKANPPIPPQETTDGYIGQAVRLWLRDCNAKNK